jgi:hypothetical protein
VALAGLILAVTAVVVLWNRKFDTDFYVLWVATRGCLDGISPYDEAAQAEHITRLLHLEAPLRLLPFGYPPWFVATTIFLGWLPFAHAGRLWFCLNLAMLFTSAAWMGPSAERRDRIVTALAAALFLPSLGLLQVGQFALPVMFGAALFLYGIRSERPLASAFGLLLMTYKPHLGAPVFLLASLWLAWCARTDSRARRTLGLAALMLSAAAIISFAVDRSWPQSYVGAVVRLAQTPLNRECDTCSTMSFFLARASGRFAPSAIAIAGFVLGLAAMAVFRRRILAEPAPLLAFGILLSLLMLPYLRNYDYAVMVLPILLIWSMAKTRLERAAVVFAWALPSVLLLLPRSSGAPPLWISALLLLAVLSVSPSRA